MPRRRHRNRAGTAGEPVPEPVLDGTRARRFQRGSLPKGESPANRRYSFGTGGKSPSTEACDGTEPEVDGRTLRNSFDGSVDGF